MVAVRSGSFYGRAMIAGDIYAVAGGGPDLGDGVPARQAALSGPVDVAVDGAGNLVIADTGHNLIRVVAAKSGTFYGQAMTKEHIYTVAGNGMTGFSGDGGPATKAKFSDAFGIAVDGAGNLLITDNQRIRVAAARTGTFYGRAMTKGDIYTVAGNGMAGFAGDGGRATKAELSPGEVAVDGAGNLVIADAGNRRVRMVTG